MKVFKVFDIDLGLPPRQAIRLVLGLDPSVAQALVDRRPLPAKDRGVVRDLEPRFSKSF